ncbi:MAG: TolC family protein, partial [Bacteroidales bacterium]|nr:TolC family protein [Bacteroidales bacterium]
EKKQSQMWENPTATAVHNIYNPINSTYFDLSKQGETDIELEIPIKNFSKARMSKRKYNFQQQSKENELLSLQYELADELLQNLAHYSYYYNAEKLYADEISSLSDIVSAFEIQYKNKNISALELSNLQTVLFNLQNEAAEVQINEQNAYFEILKLLNTNANSDFHSVLNVNNVFEQANVFLLSAVNDSLPAFPYSITALDNEQRANHYAVKEFEKDNLPVWNFKTEWDKNGSIAYNVFLAGFSVQLPVFNRNQGNIATKKAENEILSQKREFLINTYKQELAFCIENLRKYCTMYADNNTQTLIDNDKLAKDMREQLINRNISLIDYQNFAENYRQKRLLQLLMAKNLLQTASRINAISNKEIFSF